MPLPPLADAALKTVLDGPDQVSGTADDLVPTLKKKLAPHITACCLMQ